MKRRHLLATSGALALFAALPAGGDVLEGHVPATEVKRLLESMTKAIGLAVPGMPRGSPGVETDGRQDPYQVLAIDVAGQSSVFAS